MQGYRISDLDASAKQLIKDKKIDKNNDGLISKENGELAELLSQANVGDIQQLGEKDERLKKLLMFEIAGGGITTAAWLWGEAKENKACTEARANNYEMRLKRNQQAEMQEKEHINKIVKNLAKKANITDAGLMDEITELVKKAEERDVKITDLEYKHGGFGFKTVPKPQEEVLAKCARQLKDAIGDAQNFRTSGPKVGETIGESIVNNTKNLKHLTKLKGLLGTAICAFSLIVNPFTMVPASVITALAIDPNKRYKVNIGESNAIAEQSTEKQSVDKQNVEHQYFKQKFEQGFKELGVSEDTELKEYTPKKGEYWISILKAKYGVDDITAQKMANKIKEMIYDDAKAAKQTPVMYLPDTWTLEGKTYNYNDKTEASKTDNYSDEVKTEMGKMSKDLKYE